MQYINYIFRIRLKINKIDGGIKFGMKQGRDIIDENTSGNHFCMSILIEIANLVFLSEPPAFKSSLLKKHNVIYSLQYQFLII